MRKKIITGVVIGCVLILSAIFLMNRKEDKYLTLNAGTMIFEYGDEVLLNSAILNHEDAIDIWKDIKVKDNFKYTEVAEKEIVAIGTYEVNLTYKKEEVKLKVIVQDTTTPEFIDFKESIEVTKGYEGDFKEYFQAKDLSEVDIDVDTSEVNLQEAGSYKTNVIATDTSKNKTTKEFELLVLDKTGEEVKQEELQMNRDNSNSVDQGEGNAVESIPTPQIADPIYRTDISNSYVAKINAYREQNGLTPLPVTAEAQAEADKRAMELISNYSHASSYGFGENIGMGSIGFDFFEAWKASPGHNGAMLEASISNAMAVSVVEYNGQWYAVTSFKSKY